MQTVAKVTAKGQITLPKSVREALGVTTGDLVVFRVVAGQAVVSRDPSFLDLAGSVSVPAAKRNASWDDVIRQTREARARRVQ